MISVTNAVSGLPTPNALLRRLITGRHPARTLIAATAVERGFVTQLDHAAYLGRELAKAEAALSNGSEEAKGKIWD